MRTLKRPHTSLTRLAYGDNHAAQPAFARAGFHREGTHRRACWRRDAWQDGVLYGLLSDEL